MAQSDGKDGQLYEVVAIADDARRRPSWIPRALRRWSLSAFLALFAVLAIALGLVFAQSQKHHGIATPLTRLRYLWTYCPSTLFIIVAGLWYLVDYNTRALAPWRAMAGGPTSVDKSLALDYVSRNQYNVLFRSVKNRHWDVTLATAGTVFLDALIVLSTGLFTLQPVALIDNNHSFPMTTQLNISGAILQNSNAWSAALAITKYRLPFPRGTTNGFAYATPNITSLTTGSKVQLLVDAIRPDVVCEPMYGDVRFGFTTQGSNRSSAVPAARVNISSASCRVAYPRQLPSSILQENFVFDFGQVNCSELSGSLPWSYKLVIYGATMNLSSLDVSGPARDVQNLSTKAYQELANNTGDGFVPVDGRIISSKAVGAVCSIRARKRRALLTIDQGVWLPALANASVPDNTFDLIGSEFANQTNYTRTLSYSLQWAMLQMLGSDNTFLGGQSPRPVTGSDLEVEKWSMLSSAPFFTVLNQTTPTRNVREMLDSNIMQHSAQRALQLIAAQYFKDSLLISSNATLPGSTFVTEDRLIMSPLALGLVVAFLVLLIVVSTAMLLRTLAAIPKAIDSIASKATVLARSPTAMDLVRSDPAPREDNYGCTPFSGASLGTTYEVQDGQDCFRIVAGSGIEKSKNIAPQADLWQPWSTSMACKILAILLPCVGIGLLEGLLHMSVKSQGFAAVSLDAVVQHTWIYIPVLVVFLLNSIFTAISSTNKVIQPFASMRESPTTASDSLLISFVNKVSPHAMWTAMKHKHFGTAAAVLATILGATLPIAVSGLYRVQTATRTEQAILQSVTSFSSSLALGSTNATQDAYPVPGLILYQNLSLPQWTSTKYVLPSMRLSNMDASLVLLENATIRAAIPALTGVANCTRISSDRIAFDASPLADGSYLYVTLKATQSCPSLRMTASRIGSRDFFYGMWLGSGQRDRFNNTALPSNFVNDTNSAAYHGSRGITDGCPKSIALVARIQTTNSTGKVTVPDSLVFDCSPYVQQVTLNTTLSVPDFQLLPDKNPSVIKGSERPFSEAELINADDGTMYLPLSTSKTGALSGSSYYDTWFRAVFNAGNGFTQANILTPGNNNTFIKDDAAIQGLLDRLDYVYGLTVAQVYNAKRRLPIVQSTLQGDLVGTLTLPAGNRVQQDATSTRIVQGVLAAMLICIAISIARVNGRNLIPENPCSIAAVGTLLAQSSILTDDHIPHGAEVLSDRELRKSGMFDHWLYSLGWWGSGEKAWYGIDIGRAEKEHT